ncbi:MAG: endonuclease/exonuclease/phosphatase family protein [Caldilineaceae bacterium]|nr:endonuclease/exonuclease/phosphatase family protein [Caldilineaceae bacterium]
MTTFTVMSWNVQNLFLPNHDDGPDTQELFRQKLASLAAVIDHVQPDILALQEVGPDGVLSRLQAALAHMMPHAIDGQPDRRGIRVAFLSTKPFEATNHIRPFPQPIRPVQSKDPIFDDPQTAIDESLTDEMGRGGLEATLFIDGKPVTVLTAHFKSKLISYARQRGLVGGNQFQPNDEGERYRYAAYALYRRTGEAVTIRQRLNEILANPHDPENIAAGTGRSARLIFCGDLNDEVEAATTQIIQGPSGSEIGTGGFARDDQGDGFRMWNLAPLLPDINGEPAYSRRYKGRGELIDHIFASHALVNPNNMPAAHTIMSPAPLPSMDDNPNARRNEPGSDHAAVVAQFEL